MRAIATPFLNAKNQLRQGSLSGSATLTILADEKKNIEVLSGKTSPSNGLNEPAYKRRKKTGLSAY